MAVEMITMHWCDVCKRRDDVKTEAVTKLDIRLSEVSQHIDLCEEHASEPVTLATLSDFLAQFASVMSEPAKKR